MRDTLRLIPAIARALGRVARASVLYPNEDDGIAPLDREKVALADAVVQAIADQAAARRARLAEVPRPRQVSVADVRRPVRRQRGA